MSGAPIGVVAALPAEAACFRGRPLASRADRVLELEGALLCRSGIGRSRARAAAGELTARGVTGLVSWGIAGALDPDLRAGDLLLPGEVRDLAGGRWTCDPHWRGRLEGLLSASLRVRSGPLLTTDAVVADPAEKRLLATTGASCVDMESAAVAEVAAAEGLPFVAVRAVCDVAHHGIPRVAVEGVTGTANPRPLRLLWNLATRPGDWPALLRLRRTFGAAQGTLRTAREVAGYGLGTG